MDGGATVGWGQAQVPEAVYSICWDFKSKSSGGSSWSNKSKWGNSSWSNKPWSNKKWENDDNTQAVAFGAAMSALAPMNAPPPPRSGGAWADAGSKVLPPMPTGPFFEGPYIGDMFAGMDAGKGGKGHGGKKIWEELGKGAFDTWSMPGGRGKGGKNRGPPPPPPAPEFDMVPVLGPGQFWGGKPGGFAVAPGFKGGWEVPMFDMKGDMKGFKGKGKRGGGWEEFGGKHDTKAGKGNHTTVEVKGSKGKATPGDTAASRRGDRKVGKGEQSLAAEDKDGPKDEVLAEIDSMLAEAHKLSNGKCSLEKGDFDFRVRRYLLAIRAQGGRSKVKDALAMLQTYTLQKSRESVQVWPAYILTLLKKFEPDPFTKSGGKGKGAEGESDFADARKKREKGPLPKAQSQPAASEGAPIVASAQTASAAGVLQVVPVLDFLQEELPPGWDEGHVEALQRLNEALPGQGKAKCPFDGPELDLGAAFVTQATSSLAQAVGKAPGTRSHLLGIAKCLELGEHCPRSAEAAGASGQGALTRLEADSTAADAAAAAAAIASGAAASVMRELGLEISLQVLRNPMIN